MNFRGVWDTCGHRPSRLEFGGNLDPWSGCRVPGSGIFKGFFVEIL